MAEQKNHSISGGLITGAGGATAAGGLVGGGIPGFKANADTIKDIKQGSWKKRTGAMLSSGRGGVFGYRTNAHQGAVQRMKDSTNHFKDKPASRAEMYQRGQEAGKIPAEEQIIGHMKLGRKASTAAMIGGAAATAYGVHRKNEGVQKALDSRTDATNAALLGGGATAAGASYGGARMLEHQGRKWGARSGQSISEAHKIIPNLGGPGVNPLGNPPNHRVPDIGPAKGSPSSSKLKRDKGTILGGKSKLQAEAAGLHRGDAAQARYFAGVYGKTAKTIRHLHTPAMVAAGMGATGLLASGAASKLAERRQDSVSKASDKLMSDAELRRRRKVQSKIGRTTSALGLTGAGLAAGSILARKPGMLKKVPILEHADHESMKDAALYTGIAAGGIGGVGGFNQAKIYADESRRRKQDVAKGASEMEMGHYGEEGRPWLPPVIEEEVSKAWTPTVQPFDSEAARHKRAKGYQAGSLVAVGASGAYAASHGRKAVRHLKTESDLPLRALKDSKAMHHGGRAAAGTAVAAGALAARHAIKHQEKNSWRSYRQ